MGKPELGGMKKDRSVPMLLLLCIVVGSEAGRRGGMKTKGAFQMTSSRGNRAGNDESEDQVLVKKMLGEAVTDVDIDLPDVDIDSKLNTASGFPSRSLLTTSEQAPNAQATMSAMSA